MPRAQRQQTTEDEAPNVRAFSSNAPPKTTADKLRLALWFISKYETVEDAELAFSAAVDATRRMSVAQQPEVRS